MQKLQLATDKYQNIKELETIKEIRFLNFILICQFTYKLALPIYFQFIRFVVYKSILGLDLLIVKKSKIIIFHTLTF